MQVSLSACSNLIKADLAFLCFTAFSKQCSNATSAYQYHKSCQGHLLGGSAFSSTVVSEVERSYNTKGENVSFKKIIYWYFMQTH